MDSDYPIPGRRKKNKVGHFKCNNCDKVYNNRAKPKYCSNTECNYYLGGKYVPKPSVAGAFLITAFLVSVRLNEAGINARAFVTIGEERKVTINFLLFVMPHSKIRVASFCQNSQF